jgi:hypothetical protein
LIFDGWQRRRLLVPELLGSLLKGVELRREGGDLVGRGVPVELGGGEGVGIGGGRAVFWVRAALKPRHPSSCPLR